MFMLTRTHNKITDELQQELNEATYALQVTKHQLHYERALNAEYRAEMNRLDKKIAALEHAIRDMNQELEPAPREALNIVSIKDAKNSDGE